MPARFRSTLTGFAARIAFAQNLEDHSERTRIQRQDHHVHLPDFGRDADEDAGGNGFQHHRTAMCSPAHLAARHGRASAKVVYDRRLQSTDLVPTIGSLMDFPPRSPVAS